MNSAYQKLHEAIEEYIRHIQDLGVSKSEIDINYWIAVAIHAAFKKVSAEKENKS